MDEIKKWSDDKLGFQTITNENLVCADCEFAIPNGPTGKCEKFNIKPNKVLLGGDCDEYESK
jgi:hypothetical protein